MARGFTARESNRDNNPMVLASRLTKTLSKLPSQPGINYGNALRGLQKEGVLSIKDFLGMSEDMKRQVLLAINDGVNDFNKNGLGSDEFTRDEQDADRAQRIKDSVSDVVDAAKSRGFSAAEERGAKETKKDARRLNIEAESQEDNIYAQLDEGQLGEELSPDNVSKSNIKETAKAAAKEWISAYDNAKASGESEIDARDLANQSAQAVIEEGIRPNDARGFAANESSKTNAVTGLSAKSSKLFSKLTGSIMDSKSLPKSVSNMMAIEALDAIRYTKDKNLNDYLNDAIKTARTPGNPFGIGAKSADKLAKLSGEQKKEAGRLIGAVVSAMSSDRTMETVYTDLSNKGQINLAKHDSFDKWLKSSDADKWMETLQVEADKATAQILKSFSK